MFLQICSATAGLSSAGFVIPRIIICILYLLTARSIFAEVFFWAKWGSLIAQNYPVWGPIFYRNRLIHAEAGVTGNLRDVVMTTMHVTWRVNVFRTAFEALQSLRLKQWCIDHLSLENGLRGKIWCNNFDTISWRYLPGGTRCRGSRKCRMGEFCSRAKILGEKG